MASSTVLIFVSIHLEGADSFLYGRRQALGGLNPGDARSGQGPPVRRSSPDGLVAAEPFKLGGGFVTIAFVEVDGLLVEFMHYANPDEEGWC
jgi:hypothetical protein